VFSAVWCGPCKVIVPKFFELSKDFPAISFWKVDGDKCKGILSKLGVKALPTFLFYHCGVIVSRMSGAKIDSLEQNLSFLNNQNEVTIQNVNETTQDKEVVQKTLQLLDFRRNVFELYRQIREKGTNDSQSYSLFINERNRLFKEHPQSALDQSQKNNFVGLNYYDYNPNYRVLAKIENAENPKDHFIQVGNDGEVKLKQIGTVFF